MIYTTDNFYKSKLWNNFIKDLKLKRIQEKHALICERCGKSIISSKAAICHHKIHLTDENVNDFNISLNEDNIEVICFKCHNIEHKRFGYENRKQVYIITGPPLAGKTTWIKDNAQDNDLIVDMNELFKAISINHMYVKPDTLKAIVFDIRDLLFEDIKKRKGKWGNAFIVYGGYLEERQAMAEKLGAEIIEIEATKEECLQRLYSNPDGRNIKDYEKYIEEYFENNPPL